MAPHALILYACDLKWWAEHKGVPGFKGLKVSQDKLAVQSYPDIHRVEVVRHKDELLFERAGRIGWGGNGGFHALNLAAQMGAARIALVGFDMTLRHGSHWHGDHPKHMHNPTNGTVDRWRRVVDSAAFVLEKIGIEVVNCSPISALKNYRKCSLDEFMNG